MDNQRMAADIAKEYIGRNLNEADTRHQIIDRIIHWVLAWPSNQVRCEKHSESGYSDYYLYKHIDSPLLIIEAKKEGEYFSLPISFSGFTEGRHITISSLMTNENIHKAITQVTNYCISEGCEYAAITNGHEWIFFKVFEKNTPHIKKKAYVIPNLNYFSECYIEARNNFSYAAVTDNQSLNSLLSSHSMPGRELYYAKEKIDNYDHEVRDNTFAPKLRPLFERYFGVINAIDTKFMDDCYVNVREFDRTYKGVYSLIKDNLSPYFKKQSVKDFEDDNDGGDFGKKITKIIQRNKSNEVIVLFGGKGSGKSTFLRKLLYHKQPAYISKHSIIAIVDLLDTAHDELQIRNDSWKFLVDLLDVDNLLGNDREKLLYLFRDKYELAKKQVLYGLDESSEIFNIKLNDLVQGWLNDIEYCAERLGIYWKNRHKGLIIVIDNTDQFPELLQDYCFGIAREVASKLDCLVIISMREERYYSSKIHGILDAFSFSSFHISSPYPELVFQRRIQFVKNILSRKSLYEPIIGGASGLELKGYKRLFNIFEKAFDDKNSPLNKFLAACAHGDIRTALDLFKGFALSGYTNVLEMTARSTWNVSIHQVVKPVLIPDRFFYDENKSKIPNVYQIRSKKNGSHFTALRLLRLLDRGQDQSNPAYISVTEIIDYFDVNFNMLEDCELNLNILLKGGFVEANNRLDKFSKNVDSVKITNYGHYMLNELAYYFAYIDLICVDCAYSSEETANYMVESSNYDRRIYQKRQPMNRVKNRLKRAESFLSYLSTEELYEINKYKLNSDYLMLSKIATSKYENEKPRIIQSAMRSQAKIDKGKSIEISP